MAAGATIATAEDFRFMARALRLAERGYYSARPNPRVGCVISRGGSVIGEGYHRRAGEPHAEINALKDAGDASGASVYVTLEPCSHHGLTPPCAEALIEAGVARVVYAVADPNPRVAGSGAARLAGAGIEVVGAVMSAPATRLNRGFFRRMHDGLPFVTIKLGMSTDAKVALQSGASQWITSPAARADVQRLRAGAGAIITGSGTVVADDPALNVRDPRFVADLEQPLRVVLDSRLRISPEARIFSEPGGALVFTASADPEKLSAFRERGIEVEKCDAARTGLDLEYILKHLARRGINDVLVEAGPTLSAAFMQAARYDELVCYVAPKLIGTDARDAFMLAAPASLAEATELEFADVRRVGADLRLTLAPRR